MKIKEISDVNKILMEISNIDDIIENWEQEIITKSRELKENKDIRIIILMN